MNFVKAFRIMTQEVEAGRATGWSKKLNFASEPSDGERMFRFAFGGMGETIVYVWANGEEEAFELAVEWLDDNAPGHLVSHDEFKVLCRESAKRLGVLWPDPDDDEAFERVVSDAETDLLIIGHTSLKMGSHIASEECRFDELHDDSGDK